MYFFFYTQTVIKIKSGSLCSSRGFEICLKSILLSQTCDLNVCPSVIKIGPDRTGWFNRKKPEPDISQVWFVKEIVCVIRPVKTSLMTGLL